MDNPLEKQLYKFIRENKLTPENIEKLIEMGMIPKSKLKDRTYYRGVCRNTHVAQWIENPGYPDKDKLPNNRPLERGPCFYYAREKFNRIFIEDIQHPEDDDGFDLFIPIEEIKTNWK